MLSIKVQTCLLFLLGMNGKGCASDGPEERIVGPGASAVTPNEFPFYALVINDTAGAPICGGTLISSYIVLTTAGCVGSTTDLSVKLGLHDRSTPTGVQTVDVDNVIQHPCHSGLNEHDLALLLLAQSASSTAAISVIPEVVTGKTSKTVNRCTTTGAGAAIDCHDCYIMGYGDGAGGFSDIPKKLQQSMSTFTSCEGTLSIDSTIEMCIVTDGTTRNTAGDVGGAWFCDLRSDGQTSAIAVLSWFEGNVDGFVKLSSYRRWIDKHITLKDKCVASPGKGFCKLSSYGVAINRAERLGRCP